MTPHSRMRPAGNEAHPKSQMAAGHDQHNVPTDDEPVRCRLCGHPLTVARSVALEIGPICAARKGVQE